MEDFHSDSEERLLQALVGLRTAEECRAFLADLCTVREVKDMAQRLDTALLLDQGASYHEIVERLGVSSATISRVSRCLTYGTGGYRTVLRQFKEREKPHEDQ